MSINVFSACWTIDLFLHGILHGLKVVGETALRIILAPLGAFHN